jgi:ADP-heptose:LPS heptosyltransferase
VAKFLIIRFSSIGDIVLTTPVIRCLKNQSEDAEIHYLTKKQYAPVLSSNPYITQIHTYDGNIKELAETLKYMHFDYVIDLHNNLRSRSLSTRLGLITFRFHKLNYYKWLLVHFGINKLPPIHIVDRYLETVHLFEVQNDNKGLDFFLPEEDQPSFSTLLPDSFQQGYIAFVTGGQHLTKKLPDDSIARICSQIGYPVVLLGGQEDVTAGEEILRLTTGNVISLCGKLTLNQSAHMVKQAKLVISHDTGLMHIAAAFRKNIISVWGNTIPLFGMYPYLPGKESFIAEVKGLKCRPCSKIGFSQCPKKHFDCMKKQDLNRIVEEARAILDPGKSFRGEQPS